VPISRPKNQENPSCRNDGFFIYGGTIACREGLSLFHPKFKEHTETSYEPLCFHDAVTALKKPKCFAICCNIGEILMALHYFENRSLQRYTRNLLDLKKKTIATT